MVVNVLVVDDDEHIVELFVELLELYKINVVGTAKNGKDAVEQYKALRPDVVFLDVMMPEYDGIFALHHIRELNPDANVIMVTANTLDEIQKMGKIKPSGFVSKPFDMSTILHILNEELHLKVEPCTYDKENFL